MVSVRNKILILMICIVFFLVGCGGRDNIDLAKETDDDFVTASINLVWENRQYNLFKARLRALEVDPNSLQYVNISVYDENDVQLVKKQFEYKDHQGTVRVKAGPDRTFVAEGKLPSGYIVFRGENSLDLERGTRPKVDILMSQDNEPPQGTDISGPSSTTSRHVTFSFSSTDNCEITGYLISEISDSDPRLKDPNWPYLSDPNWKEIDPNWQAEKKDEKIYQDDINFTLSKGDGTKTVYLCFRDGIGNKSVIVNHSIEFESSLIPPQNITIFPADGRVTILWDAIPEATDYNVYMADSNGVSKTNYFAKETVNTTSYYTWTGLTNGIAYYFVLTSENSLNGEGPDSSEIAATPNAQQNYYIFPDSGIDTAPADVTIIGKGFQETTTISLYGYGGGPYIKGSCDTPGSAYGVYLEGNYAYVADSSSGLQVIDISDPNTPSIIGTCDTPRYAYDVYVSGNYAYVADEGSGLQVIDISDPNAPSIISFCDTPGYANGVYVVGNYAYVADNVSGLQVIDISDPNTPYIIGSFNTPDIAGGVYIADNYAYVTARYSGLQVIDISDPNTLSFIGSCNTPGAAHDVYVLGNYAYVADYAGLQVIDISDPNTPSFIGSCNMPGSAADVYVLGNYAYMADYAGLQVIDISDSNVTSIIGSCNTPGNGYDVYVLGNYAYMADLDSGLQVIDISDPNTPSIIGTCDTPGSADDVYVASNYAYVADRYSGLQVIDISDPNIPSIIGTCNTSGYAFGVYVAGNYAYVIYYYEVIIDWSILGLQVIDISDPNTPAITGSCDIVRPFPFYLSPLDVCLYVVGNNAYMVDGVEGLRVIDISDPNTPSFIGLCNTPGSAYDVYVADNYAYVTDSSSGLQVIDISDPNTPSIIGTCNTPGSAYGVYVADNYAYVADDYEGLQVINISDPNNPYIIGSFSTPGKARGVYITDNYAYVTARYSGLQIIEKYKPINDIKYLDSYIIEGTVPADYRPGTYNLHITNSDGEHTVLHNSFTVYHLP